MNILNNTNNIFSTVTWKSMCVMMLHVVKIIHISNSAVLTKTHTAIHVPVFVFLKMLKKDLVNLK